MFYCRLCIKQKEAKLSVCVPGFSIGSLGKINTCIKLSPELHNNGEDWGKVIEHEPC